MNITFTKAILQHIATFSILCPSVFNFLIVLHQFLRINETPSFSTSYLLSACLKTVMPKVLLILSLLQVKPPVQWSELSHSFPCYNKAFFSSSSCLLYDLATSHRLWAPRCHRKCFIHILFPISIFPRVFHRTFLNKCISSHWSACQCSVEEWVWVL